MKASLQKLFPVNSFARGVAVLSSGTGGAQLLLLLAAPVLTRLYSPEDFGVLAVFVSILSILGVIASLRYELAIPIAEDDQTALNVVALCLLITIGMAFFTGILVWLAGDWFAEKLNVAEVSTYFWLLPIGVFLIGIYQTFNYWATREKAFGRISKTKLTQSVSSLLVQFSFFKLGPLGLIAGYITGQVFGAGRLAKSAFDSADRRSFSFHRIKSAASRYRRFPQFTTWSGLINTSGHQLAPLVLASFFGTAIAGWYALANRVVSMPANLIGSAVGQVFFAHAAEAKKQNKLAELVENVQTKLIMIALPVSILIFLVGADVFAWLFGEDWRMAGEFAQWLILSSFAGFLISSLSMIFPVLEKQGQGLMLQIILFILKISGLLIGLMFNDYLLAIILYAIGGMLGYSIYVVAINISSGARLSYFLRNFIILMYASVLVCIPIILQRYFFSSDFQIWAAILSSVLLLTVYYIIAIKISFNKPQLNLN